MNEPEPEQVTADGAVAAPTSDWKGEELKSTLKFLAVPAVLGGITTALQLPTWVLYGVGAVIAVVLLSRTMKDPEWLMALAIIYLPFSMMYVIPIAPGVNGTNGVLLLLLYCVSRHGYHPSMPPPGTGVVKAYAFITLFSVVTAFVTVSGDFVLDHWLDVKRWIDPFIVFFTFVRLLRNGNMARRMMVYMMLGAVAVLIIGFQEWLEKRGVGSMEKARLLGPQLQPNDFGAFLAYSATPFLAWLLVNIHKPRVLAVCVPFLLTMARVLLATFSRGAYFGFAVGAVVAGYIRGKMFLLGAAVLGLALVIAVPEVVPQSLQARMGQTSSDPGPAQKLDNSSQTRLILWEAAMKMTMQSPLFGWGFKTFPKFKSNFTEQPVHESDNHNMYLYLASQMGIPAVVVFALLLWRTYAIGVQVYRMGADSFTSVCGMSAAALAACTALINMFGSRMVDISVTVYFWITLAVVSRLRMEIEERKLVETEQ
ncbi:MAG: O-antigen ligase family protein [Myxococcota bacterium]